MKIEDYYARKEWHSSDNQPSHSLSFIILSFHWYSLFVVVSFFIAILHSAFSYKGV